MIMMMIIMVTRMVMRMMMRTVRTMIDFTQIYDKNCCAIKQHKPMCGVFGICVGVFGVWYSQRARESTREREPLALSGSLWLSLALSG